MADIEHEGLDETRLEHAEVVETLSLIETTFRNYREMLLSVSGHVDFTEKDDKSLVTELDFEVERAVQAEFTKKYPNLPVYGEETGYGEGEDSAFWLIDPIDGTKSFIDGTPSFSNMAALIENGETRAAIIYNPVRDDVYTAIKDHGAYKNGVSVDITSVEPVRIALCKDEFHAEIEEMLAPADIQTVSPPSGGGDGFTKVLDGLVVARFQMHASGFAHDYAPGALLVAEAGGIIIPIKTDVYTYDSQSFVACHPIVADLVALNISRLRKLDQ